MLQNVIAVSRRMGVNHVDPLNSSVEKREDTGDESKGESKGGSERNSGAHSSSILLHFPSSYREVFVEKIMVRARVIKSLCGLHETSFTYFVVNVG